MRAEEFTQGRVMAKIESTGKIVEILRHADQVSFSDETGWLLVNTNPDTKSHMGVKWIPDSTRFAWVKNFESLKETKFQLPSAIEEFLDSLNPDDCGVEDIGAYRIHFEGFTSDCKSSSDYRRNPDAVYQQVYRDFIQREGGQRPVMQDMVGDERFPILFSIFRRRQKVAENQQATAKQVLNYINKTHHEPFRPGEKMYRAVMAHPRWELQRVPLLNLNLPDQEYDDVDYYDNPPESDSYGRTMLVDPEHAGRVSQHLIDKQPIVIDADRYIIDGNHRAWAAKYLLNRDYINAWVPVEQIREDQEEYLYHATYRPLLKSIKAKGLGNTTQSQWTDSQPGVVYLARDPEVARSYAEAAESVPEEWLDQIVVLQIIKSKLNPKLLHQDRNVQDNTGDTLEYHAVIPAKLLSVNNLNEVNYPDELTVSDQIQQYFFKRGYNLAGEGRDQMAFESPRGTIVKVLGTGDPERENIVRNYVTFFERNQRNPFYPRIYSSGEFTVDGETYFVYEMERVNYVANEEATLDYIEKLMSAVDREQGEQFLQRNPVPAEISEEEIYGLIQATEDMIQAIGGMAPLDLSAVENLGRRNNGHLVIVDPFSL